MARDPVTHTFHSSVGAAGNGSPIMTKGLALVGVQIEGITTATITFEGTIDNSNWVAVLAANMQNGTTGTTATADGLYLVATAGLQQLRCRISAYTSGAITATGLGLEQGGVSFADVEATISSVTLGSPTDGTYIGDIKFGEALPAGSAAIGKLGANSGVDIGDVDVTSLPSAVQGPGNPTVDSYSSAVVNLAASTSNQELVATPGASKQIWVYALFMMADTAAGTVVLQDEDDTALSGTMAVSDEGGWVLPHSGNFAMPWIKVATNKALEADTGACTIDGIICYGIVSV